MIRGLAESFVMAARALGANLRRIELLSRAASILLTVVLVMSTAFAFDTADVTRSVASRVDSVRTLTDHLRTAQYALLQEQSLERAYRISPEGPTFVAHRVAANALVTAMEAVRAMSDLSGRRSVDSILAAHRTYLRDTRLLFIATNREQSQLVTTIQRDRVDPVFDEIDEAIGARVKMQADVATIAILQLREAQNRVVDITAILSMIGIGCLGCFLLIVRTYRLRSEKTHVEELRKLESTALLDALTGIGNHRAYKQDLAREVSRAMRHCETITLALLDIDDFKLVNDRNGHVHGDEVLLTLANSLASLRANDLAYRIGGDEFAVIMPHTSIHGANEIMRKLQLDKSAALFGNTLSIGLASLSGPSCNAETLQGQADAAMYAAKRSGRNTVTAYDESLDGMWQLSPVKLHNLRLLISSRSMKVVFQPIWDLQRCEILAYEALTRPDAIYGFAGPQDAFDLAERVGRAHELDAACREAVLARATDLPPKALLFINISPQSLDHGRFDASAFANAVRAAGLAPDRVVIEITERTATQVAALVAAALDIRKHGFRLALDDTGAGNSGLEMLSRLPLEFVKIDRDIVAKALVDKKARGVIAGIIAVAKATDAYVIAEGIETAEMLEYACGAESRRDASPSEIHGVQGYFLRRPQETFLEPGEADDVKALLRLSTSRASTAHLV